ncbi:MAG: sulfatase-like hydrolase/transferase [Planctomycetota bacterium]
MTAFHRLVPSLLRWVSLSVFLSALLSCGPGTPPPQAPRLGSGVLVIEVDAWRRDDCSLYEPSLGTMPGLEKWQDQCLVFEDAWSTGADPKAAAASLLTGCDALLARHPGFTLPEGDVLQKRFPWSLPEAMPRLAFEYLLDGWRTALFDSDGGLQPLGNLKPGLERIESPEDAAAWDLPEVKDRLEYWLRSLKQGDDWFAYVHCSDLERFAKKARLDPAFGAAPGIDCLPPLGATEPLYHALPASRAVEGVESIAQYRAMYRSALRQLDTDLLALRSMLAEQRLLGRTTIVLVGGYGLSFGESGLFLQSGSVSEADLAVPLILRPAPDLVVPVGRRLDTLVSLVDVAPTLMQWSGLRTREGLQGHDLRPTWAEEMPVRNHAYALATLHSGYAVIDDRGLWLEFAPQRGGSVELGLSWWGRSVPLDQTVEILLARREGLRGDAWRQGVSDPVWGDELRKQGRGWFQWGLGLAEGLHLEDGSGATDSQDGAWTVPAWAR